MDKQTRLYSYLFGLFGTDGWVTLNRTKEYVSVLNIELIDKDVLNQITKMVPDCSCSERTRDTNFKKKHHSYVLRCTNKELINWLVKNGFPLTDKTNTIKPPIGEYSEADFWRGIIDGDGSVGLKKAEEQPFLSLTTKSEALKESYDDFIEKYTGFRPNNSRNMRDNIYNITLHGKKAIKIMSIIYENSFIHIDRKYQNYLQNKDWQGKKRLGGAAKKWTPEEEADLLIMTNRQFALKYPYRSIPAIRGKRTRLTGSASDEHLKLKKEVRKINE